MNLLHCTVGLLQAVCAIQVYVLVVFIKQTFNGPRFDSHHLSSTKGISYLGWRLQWLHAVNPSTLPHRRKAPAAFPPLYTQVFTTGCDHTSHCPDFEHRKHSHQHHPNTPTRQITGCTASVSRVACLKCQPVSGTINTARCSTAEPWKACV